VEQLEEDVEGATCKICGITVTAIQAAIHIDSGVEIGCMLRY